MRSKKIIAIGISKVGTCILTGRQPDGCVGNASEGLNQINLEYLVGIATRTSFFGQRTIFGLTSYLFPTMSFFYFFRITVQAGIPVLSFFPQFSYLETEVHTTHSFILFLSLIYNVPSPKH